LYNRTAVILNDAKQRQSPNTQGQGQVRKPRPKFWPWSRRLAGWSLTSPFSTNTAIWLHQRRKVRGGRVILLPSEGRLAIF